MSQVLDIETTIAPRGSALWRSANSYAHQALDTLVSLATFLRQGFATWAKRRRKRHELLDYMAQDHRAAADIGSNPAAADFWAQQPFWRA